MAAGRKTKSLLPHEHGAYGQFAVPLATGLALGRPTPGALLLAVAATCGFLAYEPLLVLAGQRGRRALEQQGARARRTALPLLGSAVALGALGFLLSPPLARWAALAPPLLAGLVALLVWWDAERTTAGEMVVATALSSCGYPVALAAGARLGAAASAWLAWAMAFAAATLAVQSLLARARGAPRDPGIRAAIAVVAILAAAVATAALGAGSWAVPAAVLPVALASLWVVIFRVPPRQLKRVGWTILCATVASSVALVAGLR